MPLPHADRIRSVAASALAALGLLLAACNSSPGGSASGAADATTPGGGTSTPASSTQSLAWAPASGPVAGYRVWVQRNGGAFTAETDVSQPRVTLEGVPGDTARIIVAAFDAQGHVGMESPPSETFTFPDPAASSSASAKAASAGKSSASTTPSSHTVAASDTGSGDSATPDASTAPIVPPSEKTAWDTRGDLVASLLWENGAALRITTPTLELDLVFPRPDVDDEVAAMGDFDGDGLADILWVGPQGAVGYTPMSSLRAGSNPTLVVALGVLAPGEGVVAAGDFDGDGLADVMLRDSADGFTTLWLSKRGAAPDVAGLGAVADAVAGVADYDADGSDDILWRTSQGSLVVWQMAGALVRGVVEVSLPASAELLASGDFDGDGAAEVAHRDPSTGIVSILRPVVGTPVSSTPALGDTRGWSPAGAADFDGDGGADLLFTGEGALRMAYLPGEAVLDLDPASPWSLVPLPR